MIELGCPNFIEFVLNAKTYRRNDAKYTTPKNHYLWFTLGRMAIMRSK